MKLNFRITIARRTEKDQPLFFTFANVCALTSPQNDPKSFVNRFCCIWSFVLKLTITWKRKFDCSLDESFPTLLFVRFRKLQSDRVEPGVQPAHELAFARCLLLCKRWKSVVVWWMFVYCDWSHMWPSVDDWASRAPFVVWFSVGYSKGCLRYTLLF